MQEEVLRPNHPRPQRDGCEASPVDLNRLDQLAKHYVQIQQCNSQDHIDERSDVQVQRLGLCHA